MRYQAFVRAAAAVLSTAFIAGGTVLAQSTVPEPVTMTDTAPLPASDRSSIGAVILMDEPVLAQREALQTAMERAAVDTRSMGAGPAQLIRDVFMQEEKERQQALDAAERQRRTPK